MPNSCDTHERFCAARPTDSQSRSYMTAQATAVDPELNASADRRGERRRGDRPSVLGMIAAAFGYLTPVQAIPSMKAEDRQLRRVPPALWGTICAS